MPIEIGPRMRGNHCHYCTMQYYCRSKSNVRSFSTYLNYLTCFKLNGFMTMSPLYLLFVNKQRKSKQSSRKNSHDFCYPQKFEYFKKKMVGRPIYQRRTETLFVKVWSRFPMKYVDFGFWLLPVVCCYCCCLHSSS